jgi:GT2 family glycosyltransferase/lipopolysaccharide/colanic/teichoic acid biosynthesis glycosyltransferase
MADQQKTDLTIIIVNYNVKEFLANCLQSIRRAKGSLNLQIIVVDNASTDGSASFLEHRFPEVKFIWNEENKGFGKANNQAIQLAEGECTLLLNPDTLLQEDTLITLFSHMKENPQTAACGCKILNPDGTYAPESRRSVPTVSSAIYKALGLTSLFPESRLFGNYYLGWQSEDTPGKIPVLSGSFMFYRTDVLKELGGFDERFFMYGEDIDLCYRTTALGYDIDYVPQTSIIHYKGESTKKGNLSYIRNFNGALYLFFDKHYTSRYSMLFKILIFLSIWMRAILSFFIQKAVTYKYVLIDLIALNVAMFLGFAARFGFQTESILDTKNLEFLWLNLLLSVLYLLFSQAFGTLKQHKYSIIGSLKAVVASFVALAVITFFARNLAFSRVILMIGFAVGFMAVFVIRLLRVNMSGKTPGARGRWVTSRVLLVGVGTKTKDVISKLNNRPDWQIEIAGLVHQDSWSGETENDSVKVIGSLSQLPELIRAVKADQVLFLMDSITHKELLQTLRLLRNTDVSVKVVPDQMDFMLGKAQIEYLDDLTLMDVDVPYMNSLQKTGKRLLDISLTLPFVVILAPFMMPQWMFRSTDKKKNVRVFNGVKHTEFSIAQPAGKNKWLNMWRLSLNILAGKMSLTGSSLNGNGSESYKTGLTGYAQINRDRIKNPDDRQRYDLYYLQNYSVWLDLDILIKTWLQKYPILEQLEETED